MAIDPVDIRVPPMEQRDFLRFRALIQRQTGIWLREGKQIMLASRLAKRMRALGLPDYGSYYSLLESGRDGGREIVEFINCVTTNKTSFFRESHHFEFLEQTLVPKLRLAAGAGAAKSVRIWSAACSTGEEPYSIAISLLEAFRGTAAGWNLEVMASDIDTTVLQKAQAAVYPIASLDSVAEVLQGRHFLRGKGAMAGQVKVKSDVREKVSFARINLMDTDWPIEGRFHVIFFRNALIYFNQETQNAFLRHMLRYLHPNGYLILGHSEHVPWLHDAVEPLSKTIYQLRSQPNRMSAPLPSMARGTA